MPVCACKCMCFSPLDQGIKNSLFLFGLQRRTQRWQKVNTTLIWALIFLMQSHRARCVKVLTEVCRKFNKTSLCVICAQHLAKFNARVNTHTHGRTRRYKHAHGVAHVCTHIYAHCETVKYAVYVDIMNVFEATDQHRVQQCRGGFGSN